MNTHELLSVSQSARLLEVAEQTMRMYDRRGVLPALRLADGRRVWLRCEVERLRNLRRQREEAQYA